MTCARNALKDSSPHVPYKALMMADQNFQNMQLLIILQQNLHLTEMILLHLINTT
jgi:hypothetical protein